MDTFATFQSRMFDLYTAKRYADALAAVEGEAHRFPEEAGRIGFWRACLVACEERPVEALGHLESWVDAGHWFAPQVVGADPDLAAIRMDPRFARVLSLCEQRHEAAQRRARPSSLTAGPHGADAQGLLVVLHGRTCHADETLPSWQAAAHAGWHVLVLQSSQVLGPRDFGWDDHALAETEVQAGIGAERSQCPDLPSRLVLAGFSQGGALAVRLTFESDLCARGVLAVVPSLPADLWPDGVPAGRAEGLFVHLVTGDRDPRAANHRSLARRLYDAGVRVQLDEHPDIGHAYPPDFDVGLVTALAKFP